MRRMQRRGMLMAALTTVALLAPAAPGLAATPSPAAGSGTATVGSAPVVPFGAHAQGATPLDQNLSFDVVLKPRNQAALDSFVQQVSTPSSPSYRHFLAPGQYQATFGPTPQAIASVKGALAKMGLQVGAVNGSIVSVSGSVAQVGSALRTGFRQYKLATGRIAHANTMAPQLPTSIASLVQAVVGLDDVVQFRRPAPATRPAALSSASISSNTAGPQPCFPEGAGYYGADQLASYYGLTSEYASNDFGSGVTVALFELEPFSSSDVLAYQRCYGTSASVTTQRVGIGAGSGSGAGEAALDIEDVIGLAPQSAIRVFEGPNSGQGVLDTWNAIAAGNAAVVSTSWGACEAALGAAFAQSERQIFQQMAAQGQTILAAAGDDGSEDCERSGSDVLAVDDPASQPEVTGVGGTNLTTATGPESAWNEGITSGNGAGGGGISTIWPMPQWQRSEGVTPDSSGLPCGAAPGSYCREVPDVSASADPVNGYFIYWSGGWWTIGGTSAAAPTWASLIALIDASCSGHRLGAINPSLYQLEAAGGAAFNDIQDGTNNDYTGTNAGAFTTAVGYDMATGLGTPVGAILDGGLCPAAAAAGSGTMTVDHATVQSSSTTTLTFTYTLPIGQGIADGEVDLAVPTGWPAPSLTTTAAGYTTASIGQVKLSGSTIQVKGVTATAGSSITITYGDTSGGGPAATAPATPQTNTFNSSVKTTATGALAAIAASPQVQVWTTASDGSGTMTASPTQVRASSTTTLTFTYTPPLDTVVTNGAVDIDLTTPVADGWTTPTTTPGAAGLVTASTGTAAVSGSTIDVTGVTLALGQTLTITYGSTAGGAPGVTAPGVTPPATTVTSLFDAQQRATAGGTLKALGTSPTVQALPDAPDGAGTLTLSPSRVSPGSNAALTFIYKAPAAAFVTDGAINVDVPADWSTPSTTGTDPGYSTAPGAMVAVAGLEIQVTGINLAPSATLVITYGSTASGGPGALVPTTDTTGVFPTTEQSTNHGTPTAFVPDPSITIANPPPPPSGGGGGGGGHPQLVRVSGADRIATSIAASQAAFPKANSARVVVLARSDSFADALAGTPLAARNNGPLLLTLTAQLQDTTIGEIGRILPIGSTIYLLGGTSAISTGIETQLSGFGYVVQRLAGPDRFATAVKIADALGDPTTVFEADGTNFPDALSAGGAAAQQGAAILLTAGSTMSSASAAYLTAHPSVRYAVGGPAAKADPGAQPLVGADRYATSVLVAETFFPSPISVGLASGLAFPDALSGGVVAALDNGPMMLVPSAGGVPVSTISYLTNAGNTASAAWLFGGTGSVADDVFTQAANALKPPSA